MKKKIFPHNFLRITYSSSSEEDEELDVEQISPTTIYSSDHNGDEIFSSDSDLDVCPDELQETLHDTNNAEAFRSREKFVESCVKEFKESELLDNLFHKSQRVGLLNDFINFM